MTRSVLVLKGWSGCIISLISPADIALVLRPALALRLLLSTTIDGEVGRRLLAPGVTSMTIVHAVDV
jgi:hypothetical protein